MGHFAAGIPTVYYTVYTWMIMIRVLNNKDGPLGTFHFNDIKFKQDMDRCPILSLYQN